MIKNKTQRLTVTSFLLALGIILPYGLGHGFGIPGNVLLPMHVPVLLCGFLCGAAFGAVCGAILPVLNCILTGMPAPFPMLPIMFFELTVYGFVSGIIFSKTKLKNYKLGIYATLIIAMICGRIAYATVFHTLLLACGEFKALSASAAIVTGLPGIIIQLLLIPPIIFVMEKNMFIQSKNAIESAKNLIRADKASCVVIKNDKIVNIEHASGISPILTLYESGLLENAVIVDKVIGKAAAMIMALGKIKACYGITVSASAIDLLNSRGIMVKYDNRVEYIINRRQDGLCPMEDAVKDITDEEKALAAIKERLKELRENK